MSIGMVSKSRNMVMGVAMLMIAFFHTTNILPSGIDNLKNYGDFGVNLFFCLSGFSMYYAWNKKPIISEFLWNRLWRIGVTYLPIAIVWCGLSFVIHECSLMEAIMKILTLQFWIDGNLLHWFVSGILVLYLITPIIMKLLKKNRFITYVILIIVSFLCCFLPYIWERAEMVRCFLHRAPVYFVGVYLGEMAEEKRKTKLWEKIAFAAMILIGLLLLVIMKFNAFCYEWKYLMYLCLTVPVLFLLSFLCDKLEKVKCDRLLLFLGSLTLEVYLIQQKVLKIGEGPWKRLFHSVDHSLLMFNIIVFAITLLVGFYYHRITEKVYFKIKK